MEVSLFYQIREGLCELQGQNPTCYLLPASKNPNNLTSLSLSTGLEKVKLILFPSLFVLTCRLAVGSCDELVIDKLAAKYAQLREVEGMKAILWMHQNQNLANFWKNDKPGALLVYPICTENEYSFPTKFVMSDMTDCHPHDGVLTRKHTPQQQNSTVVNFICVFNLEFF
jgi:hypothetical protein